MYELFKAVIEPYFLLLASQGVLLIWTLRRGTSHRRWLWSLLVVWVLLVILSTPMVGRVLSATLTWPYRPSDVPAGEVDAIVVLGGGLSPPNAYRPRAQVTGSSYVRCLHAADLYERYRCP